ncbi:MAG: hypothetical protein HYY52_06615 [Candidatus Melainabacteria bacterium]|nr:hypothetical protein [Candidatus Melainabacteria bacterium]
MKRFVCVFVTFIFSFVYLLPFAEVCRASAAVSQALEQTEEFGPLQMAIADLESIQDLLDQGKNKTAITILKSAIGQLRKIKGLTPRQVKGMGARLKKAIKAIKAGNNTSALSEVNHVLGELGTL